VNCEITARGIDNIIDERERDWMLRSYVNNCLADWTKGRVSAKVSDTFPPPPHSHMDREIKRKEWNVKKIVSWERKDGEKDSNGE
jgi:hypothetical protein